VRALKLSIGYPSFVSIVFCCRLDCCIGDKNHQLFVLGALLSAAALVYGAILTLTTVCHPSFYIMETILLPDDCSDVYHDFV